MSGKSIASLEIEDGYQSGSRIMRVRGELDLTNASLLETALTGSPDGTTILDLSGVVFVDSVGIRTIDAAYKRLRNTGRTLIAVAPPDSRAGWTFRVAGFTGGFVLESIDAALIVAGDV